MKHTPHHEAVNPVAVKKIESIRFFKERKSIAKMEQNSLDLPLYAVSSSKRTGKAIAHKFLSETTANHKQVKLDQFGRAVKLSLS